MYRTCLTFFSDFVVVAVVCLDLITIHKKKRDHPLAEFSTTADLSHLYFLSESEILELCGQK